MTDHTHPAPTPVALIPIYEVKNLDIGDQFIIYAPTDHHPAGLFTVAHVTGAPRTAATANVCLVSGEDLPAYAEGAVRILRARHPGTDAPVCTNTAPEPLRTALPR